MFVDGHFHRIECVSVCFEYSKKMEKRRRNDYQEINKNDKQMRKMFGCEILHLLRKNSMSIWYEVKSSKFCSWLRIISYDSISPSRTMILGFRNEAKEKVIFWKFMRHEKRKSFIKTLEWSFKSYVQNRYVGKRTPRTFWYMINWERSSSQNKIDKKLGHMTLLINKLHVSKLNKESDSSRFDSIVSHDHWDYQMYLSQDRWNKCQINLNCD